VREKRRGVAQQLQQLNIQDMSREEKHECNLKYDAPWLLENMINVRTLSPNISWEITTDESSVAQSITRSKSIRTLDSRSS
jgi:hypothetical protein